jgi:ring-1,2-phenylacetyl-CoA epoxidase subunit PaaC
VSDDARQRLAYVLRLGDNALIHGQQLGALVAKGPELEEEMASANFALDYIGQARMYYALAADIEGKGRGEDDFAFLRDGWDYHNLLLLEQPNGDFANTVARQFLFETFYLAQLERLSDSSDTRLAEIAAKAHKEIRYHLRHAHGWLLRLGDGTEESHRRMQAAIDDLWRYTGEMFEADEVDAWAEDSGVGLDPGTLRDDWLQAVRRAFAEATLELPEGQWMASGGKQGRHTEHLGYLLAEMQFLQRAYPGLTW